MLRLDIDLHTTERSVEKNTKELTHLSDFHPLAGLHVHGLHLVVLDLQAPVVLGRAPRQVAPVLVNRVHLQRAQWLARFVCRGEKQRSTNGACL